MNLPYQFPDPQVEAAERARAFQQLSPDERWREIAALMAFGLAMTRNSPRREWIEQRWAEEESQWQQRQQELFARHAE